MSTAGSTVCLLCPFQSQKGGGFFRLPSLQKFPYRRMAVIESAKLPQEFMKINGNFRICYRHYKLTDINTNGKRLGLKRGTYLFTFLFFIHLRTMQKSPQPLHTHYPSTHIQKMVESRLRLFNSETFRQVDSVRMNAKQLRS